MYLHSFMGGLALLLKIFGNGQLRHTTLLFWIESKDDIRFLKKQWFLCASGETLIFVPAVTQC
jgi:hypothetical protein